MTLRSWVAARPAPRSRARAPATAGAGSRDEPTWLATVPIGYGDGWRRGAHEQRGRADPTAAGIRSWERSAWTTSRSRSAPTPTWRWGTRSVLIGAQGEERILAEEVARRLGTINYEVTTGLLPRVTREHVAVTGSWTVGGALRDELLGREVTRHRHRRGGRPGGGRARARAEVRGPVFRLSEAFGAWRVRGPHGRPRLRLRAAPGRDDRGGPRAARLHDQRDGARRVEGGDLIDPLGGRADIESRTLRVIGPEAYESDPLRAAPPGALRRRARLSSRTPDTERLTATRPRACRRPPASACSRSCAGSCSRRAPSTGSRWPTGSACSAAVLPELSDLHDVEQSHFHHRDVYGHTLEVLERLIELEARGDAGSLREVLDEPLADELTRGQALRFGALLHDIGKPATHDVRDGRPRDVHGPRPARRGDGARR